MRKRALCYLVLSLLGLVAIGCNSSDSMEPQPLPQYLPTPGTFPPYTFPLVDLVNGKIPLPNNFVLDPATGQLNLPGGTTGTIDNTIDAANSLDGFSTTGPIVVPFRGPLIATSVTQASLPVYDTTTGQPIAAKYTVTEAEAGSVVTIVPVRPLSPDTTYIVVLTQGLTSALSNSPIIADNVINFIQQPTPLVDGSGESITLGLDDPTAQKLEAVRLANQPVIEGAATLTGTPRQQIPFAFSFTTQSLFTALPAAHAVVETANAPLVNGLPSSSPIAIGHIDLPGPPNTPYSVDQFWNSLPAQLQAVPHDKIERIYQVTVKVPQFRNNLLTDYWANPAVQTGTIDAKVLIFLPTAAPGSTPVPAVIFQHGITRTKADAFVLANAFNSQGIAVVATDMPLHGDQKAPGATSDGEGFINPAMPRVSRDNIRQAVVNLYALTNAIYSGQTDIDGVAGPELVPGTIASPMFIGTSLGAMVGDLLIATDPHVGRAVLNVPGGRIVPLLLSSPAFGPPVLEGLAAKGIEPGTEEYAKFIIFTQAVLDDVDPLNYATAAVSGSLRGGTPSRFLQQLATNDTVILPENQYDLAIAAGANPAFAQVAGLMPMPLIAQIAAPYAGSGLFEFQGDHGALLDPSKGPTVALVTQAITFLGTGNIANTGVHAQQAGGSYQAEDLTPYAKAIAP